MVLLAIRELTFSTGGVLPVDGGQPLLEGRGCLHEKLARSVRAKRQAGKTV